MHSQGTCASVPARVIAVLPVVALLALSGCNESREVLARAYVAPASLNVRGELSQKSGTVATVKHGDMVGIVDSQRRMVKIRTSSGFEGWVDALELLSSEQMDNLRRERKGYLALPSEGTATAYESLNVHIEPSRSAPAFAQIAEGASVTVLGHRTAPKISAPVRSPALLFDRPQPLSRRPRRETAAKFSSRLPPKPAPPKPPANWQELSAERIDGGTGAAEGGKAVNAKADKEAVAKAAPQPAEAKRPVVMEGWTLIRSRNNEVGWVLSRNLLMSIPDEVAQYAEGKHITAFFDLGAVNDSEKGVKHDWLWTTAAGLLPYDFDSWRVFLWNPRHHRYETSYRQRDVEGYFPVHVDAETSDRPGRSFQLVTKDDDGKFRRRGYFFDGTRVHLSSTEDYRPDTEENAAKTEALDAANLKSKMAKPGWFRRQLDALRRLLPGGG